MRCAICYSTRKGAFKRVLYSPDSGVNRGEWAHIACAFWTAGVGFRRSDDDRKAEVQYVDALQPQLYSGLTTCEICGGTDGAKLKCTEPRCQRWVPRAVRIGAEVDRGLLVQRRGLGRAG